MVYFEINVLYLSVRFSWAKEVLQFVGLFLYIAGMKMAIKTPYNSCPRLQKELAKMEIPDDEWSYGYVDATLRMLGIREQFDALPKEKRDELAWKMLMDA